MKKAVVIGGSNGIGLAISKVLIKRGYCVNILDCCEPDDNVISKEYYKYYYFDLLNLNEELLNMLKEDKNINILMITAGIGRVASFKNLNLVEIKNTLEINTVSTIKIIRLFYDRIYDKKSFYCGIMGSISGWCSSPLFSVYSASKAAICRLVESVNIELEVNGFHNRILNVSPGSIKGTRFNGGKNDLSLIIGLAENIVYNLLSSNTLFIPEYEKIYKNVLESYNQNPHRFGIDSYNYKKNLGRISDKSKIKIGYLSGTFDLFHIGHLNLLRRAKKYCDYLIVGVHPNAAHKGKQTFIPFKERKEIVSSIKYVDKVIDSYPEDNEAWEIYHYDKLFVGSDYKNTEKFNRYEEYFSNKNVEIIYFPYTKSTSSTQLRKLIFSDIEKFK